MGILSNPFYLFIITNSITNEETTGIFIDESKYKDRYNLFKIPRSLFPVSGWFKLQVYEQSSETNIDPMQFGLLVEETTIFVDFGFVSVYNENTLTNIENQFLEYDGN